MLTAVRRRRSVRARRFVAWVAAPLILVATGVPAAVAAPAASAAPAVARPAVVVSQYVLVVPPLAKSSSTGRSLKVAFDVSDSADGVPDNVTIDLVGNGGIETHAWEFDVPNSSITKTASGMTLKSGTALGTYGTIKLTATNSGASKTTCLAGFKETQQPVTVKESFSFVTHSTGSKAWGSVSASSISAPKGANVGAFTETPCTSVPNDCSAGASWDLEQIGASGGYVFIGNTGAFDLGSGHDIDLGRVLDLSAPAGAVRTDVVLAKEPLPTITKHGTSASMKVTTSGASITGSATLKSLKASSTDKEKCSATKTDKIVDWPASYTNGSKPLTAVEQIFGKFSAKNITKRAESDQADIVDETD
jgi:hypothetical protein